MPEAFHTRFPVSVKSLFDPREKYLFDPRFLAANLAASLRAATVFGRQRRRPSPAEVN